jgi:hypothetical protein
VSGLALQQLLGSLHYQIQSVGAGCPGLLLNRGAAVLDHAFLSGFFFPYHQHNHSPILAQQSSRSLLILSLSLQACDIISVQALQQLDTQDEKISTSFDHAINLLEID